MRMNGKYKGVQSMPAGLRTAPFVAGGGCPSTTPNARRKNGTGPNQPKPKSSHGEKRVPDISWALTDLEDEIAHEQTAVLFHEKRMAIHTYRLGRALALARKKVDHGSWGPFLEKHSLSVATDCRARQLFERAPSEHDIEGLTIQQAYKKFGISTGKDKSKKPEPQDGVADGTSGKQAPGGKNELSEKANLPDPPKEDPDSFGMRLAQLVSRAEWLADNVSQATPIDAERTHWLSMADHVRMAVTTIMEALNAR